MADDIEGLMRRWADGIDPDVATQIDRAYEIQFAGVSGKWFLDLRRPADPLSREAPEGELCRLGMHTEDLESLLAGRSTLQQLFHVGRLRVFQDMASAMRLDRLFSKPTED